MTDKTDSKEREAFEAWYALRHPQPVHENSTWAHASKVDDWEVWKARASMQSTGFYAADMATASAQGFRDGVASLAARGSEPVAADGWLHENSLLYRLTDERHPCNRDEINVTMADGSRSIEARSRRALELLDRIRATHPSPPEGMVGGWISVKERLPEHRQSVAFIVDSENWETFKYLHGRVLGGSYLSKQGFSVPGLSLMASHWMPLPPPPTSSADSRKGE